METTRNLEGLVRCEGNILVAEGKAGMQMYNDTMQLALTKTIKTRSIISTALWTAAAFVSAYLAYKFDNLYFTGGALAL